MPFKRKSQTKLTVLSVFLILVIIVLTARAYTIQITKADEYTHKTDGAASILTTTLKAPRGEIVDSKGKLIAYNRDGYNIVFNKAYVKDNLNEIILALCNLLATYDTKWTDELPITNSAPYEFKADTDTARLLKLLEVADYVTAETCFNKLVEKYKLESFSEEQQRKIMGVRYSMTIADFSVSYPFTFAEDIPTELMRKVAESFFLLDGVTIEVAPFREYADTTLAVNLIGSVGPIFKEDWEELKEKGYSYNDKVGKSGIEKWGESFLKGTDGELTYRLDKDGNILSKEITKEPTPGKTLMLTLDSAIQRTAQDALQTAVKTLRSQGSQILAGTAVAVNIKTGAILCGANYPTYDISTMSQNYNSLASDPTRPLTNRAFQGVYPIGSTIKPIVALAALENGKYNIGETIFCKREYDYFSDYKPDCMHYHGTMGLTNALSKSCNYFFFELGKRVGATTLTQYFKDFGLGVKTGVEVDDSKGIILEPKTDGVGGDTLQISIGQMNAFTPLQLANYAATLANGGTHYKATLIDKVVEYNNIEKVFETMEPQVINTVTITDEHLNAVKVGMLSVTEDGTGRTALGDYPIKVGGKTGTSQVEGKTDHSIFVAFAPYDDPEIAISAVLEHGDSTFHTVTVVRKILDAFFYPDGHPEDATVS